MSCPARSGWSDPGGGRSSSARRWSLRPAPEPQPARSAPAPRTAHRCPARYRPRRTWRWPAPARSSRWRSTPRCGSWPRPGWGPGTGSGASRGAGARCGSRIARPRWSPGTRHASGRAPGDTCWRRRWRAVPPSPRRRPRTLVTRATGAMACRTPIRARRSAVEICGLTAMRSAPGSPTTSTGSSTSAGWKPSTWA